MKIFKAISPYFKFTKAERKGVVILLILLFMVFIFKAMVPLAFKKHEPAMLEIDYISLKAKEKKQQLFKEENEGKGKQVKRTYAITPERFDPNISTYGQLVRIGFSRKAANTIIKYRNAGGIFRLPKDLYKIYGVDSTNKELIANYCYISDSFRIENKKVAYARPDSFDLNTTTSEQLETLPGIGKVLGERIIKYRNLLGGFVSDTQLIQVYGIEEETFLSIQKYVWADPAKVKRINLNTVSEKDLKRHPYINNYQVKAIMKYRSLEGSFTTCNDLLENNLLSKSDYDKISPYLNVE